MNPSRSDPRLPDVVERLSLVDHDAAGWTPVAIEEMLHNAAFTNCERGGVREKGIHGHVRNSTKPAASPLNEVFNQISFSNIYTPHKYNIQHRFGLESCSNDYQTRNVVKCNIQIVGPAIFRKRENVNFRF